ncbi:MAG: hypothetical protein HIU92_14760 [Proteobacteria bacterium]|nr:hypothetical protein [Pseudomonadota bacterium]
MTSRISQLIRRPPAVVVHGLADAREALGVGLPVTLVSAPGAALYAGAGWWTALTAAARAEYPGQPFDDLLDCGDAPGRAAEALRAGQRLIVLRGVTPALHERVRLMAEALGAVVLTAMPEALDLARPGARRRLPDWLRSAPVWTAKTDTG